MSFTSLTALVVGSGSVSKRTFLFGSFEMLIKLVPGNSAGTMTAYYVSFTDLSKAQGFIKRRDRLLSS